MLTQQAAEVSGDLWNAAAWPAWVKSSVSLFSSVGACLPLCVRQTLLLIPEDTIDVDESSSMTCKRWAELATALERNVTTERQIRTFLNLNR
jgi:hypothetical protein